MPRLDLRQAECRAQISMSDTATLLDPHRQLTDRRPQPQNQRRHLTSQRHINRGGLSEPAQFLVIRSPRPATGASRASICRSVGDGPCLNTAAATGPAARIKC